MNFIGNSMVDSDNYTPAYKEVEEPIKPAITSIHEDFYFVDKMEGFWSRINYDLLERIVNP